MFRFDDAKHAAIAAQRLARQAGRAGFGNARAVRNLYERTLKRQVLLFFLGAMVEGRQALHARP